MYRIEITKLEKNPNYDEEIHRARSHSRAFDGMGIGSDNREFIPVGVLSTIVTEEQYKKIQRTVMENWE